METYLAWLSGQKGEGMKKNRGLTKMKRWYHFLLKDSFRTEDIEAHTVKQAYRKAVKKYGDRVCCSYQVCSKRACVFSSWLSLSETARRGKG